MASVNHSKTTFISHKLKFLKDKGDHLISDVGLYVSRIIAAGESWTEGGDNKLKYQELSQMIDTAVEFLCEKGEEIAANQHSQPSCEQPGLTSQAITATASTSATSNIIQPSVLVQPADETQLKPVLARIAVIEEALCSFRGNGEKAAEQISGIDQQLKELLCKLSESDKKHSSRFKKVKEQISEISDVQDAINEEHKTRLQSLERELQKVSTAQDAINEEHKAVLQSLERQLQKVSTAQDAINEEHKAGLQSLERQLQKVSTAQDAVNEEHKAGLQSLERQLQKVSTAHDAVNEEHKAGLQSLERQLQKVSTAQDAINEEHKAGLQSLERQLQKVSTAHDAINEEHKAGLQSLERQLQKVSTAQDRLDKEVELQAELAEKLVHLPNQLEALKENVDVLDARIERIIDDCVKEHIKVLNTRTDIIIDECSIKHEEIKTVTDDLVDKVAANTHTIQVIYEGQEQKMVLLSELETRLKTLEVDKSRNVKDFQKQVEKGETNLRILCQMLCDRLTPLEKLRTSLIERTNMRDDNINKLSQVIQEVAAMSPRLQQLELKASGPGCGFSASKMLFEAIDGMTLTRYGIWDSTVGNNFDADSGIFTAPFDGLYVVSVSSVSAMLRGNNVLRENVLQVDVKYQNNLSDVMFVVCQCRTRVKDTTACSVCVVALKVGDKLFTSVYGNNKSCISNVIYFTCFLLR